MAMIPSSVLLWSLTLPGTHESTAYIFKDTAFNLPFTRTQKFNIGEQLHGGVRYIEAQVVQDESSEVRELKSQLELHIKYVTTRSRYTIVRQYLLIRQ
mmetsp:Transcript_6097/g.9293  ORF Transcript_6097/g.9293 Transcript_6097/m.9293 type:complete len:98 (+) Transcript_6097:519-812(+)